MVCTGHACDGSRCSGFLGAVVTGRKSRSKGQRGERELFTLLNGLIGREVFKRHANPFFGRGKPDASDSELPVALEVKFQETLSLPAWIKQAREQARDGQVPVLGYRRSREPWTLLVIMTPEQFAEYYNGTAAKDTSA